ncbi:MAG: PAS domain S-box protein [Candidatus Marinimicrobia bacterium]|nr:PAS domain S-box protein [Candidatus Neomarinimicrobiota bacterium]
MENKKHIDKFSEILENSIEGIYQSSPEGKFITVNPAVVKMFRYNSASEMLAIENTADLYWDSHERQRLTNLLETDGVLLNKEIKLKRSDGELLWVLVNSRAVRNNSGKVLYYEGTSIDITERKIVESAQLLQQQISNILNEILRNTNKYISLDECFLNTLKILVTAPFLSLLEKGGIFLVDPVDDVLVLKTHLNFPVEQQQLCSRVLFDNCLCGKAAKTGQVLYTQKIDEQHEIAYNGIIPHGHYIIPILSSNEVLGVIVVYLSEEHEENLDEIEFMKSVADILSGAIRREQAEKMMQEKHDLLIESQTNAHIGNWSHDLITNEIYWSDESFRIIGRERQDLTVEVVYSFTHPDDMHVLHDVVKESTAGKIGMGHEIRILRPNGEIRWIHHRWFSIYDKNGKEIKRLGTHQDITERKNVEQELRESEEKLQSVMRIAQQLELARTPNEIVIPLKEEIEKILGYKSSWIYLIEENAEYATLFSSAGEKDADLVEQVSTIKIVGDPFMEEIVRADHTVIVEDAQTDPRTNKEIVERLGNRTIINVPIIFENHQLGCIGTGTFGDEGVMVPSESELNYLETVARHIAVVIDRIKFITENKESAEKIRQLAYFNENIVSSAPVGIVTVNTEGNVTSANEAFLKMMRSPGLEETLKLGMNTKSVLNAGITEAFNNALANGDPFELKNLHYISHWGKELIVTLKGVPQKTIDGEITGLILVIDDVTERIKSRQKIEKALEIAEQANRVKTLFMANMSHEIRTPLNSILGFYDVIKERYWDKTDEEEQLFFDSIQISGQRLLRTIHEVLDISQMEAGIYKMKLEKLDLKNMILEIVQEYQPMARDKSLKLNFNADLNSALIRADEYGVSQAIYSLIDNAIKYTQQGKIDINLEQNTDNYILIIKDTGIGISNEYLSSLFEPFSQESEGYTKKYQGIGLGLSLTKRHLDLNKIDIDVNSIKGVGTTFTLCFEKLKML